MKKLTILFAAIALVCFSVPAMAVDWNFYGSARMATYYVSDDLGKVAKGAEDGVQDTQWDFQGNSRIGANVKAEHIKGQFELGLKGTGSGDVDVGTRRLYGQWDFGAGKLKVGKDYTPVSQFISGQAFDGDLGLLGIGTMYGSRLGQVALSFGGFTVALITPQSGNFSNMASTTSSLPATLTTRVVGTSTTVFRSPGASATTYTASGTVQETLPKLEVGWGMAFDTWNFGIQGGAQTYEVKDVVSKKDGKKNDIDVTSYELGATAGVNFGPAYVKASGAYGQNWSNANWAATGYGTSVAYWDGDDGTDDTTSWMAALVAGLKVSDMLSFEAGFGYRVDDPDLKGYDKQKQYGLYGQAVIVLAPGVYIIPEVGYFDKGDGFDGDDAGNRVYAGGKWQIDF
jgi:hypothetical protein